MEMGNAFEILVGMPEGLRLLGRPRRKWEDNIKMDLKGTGWDVAWVYMAQDRGRLRDLVNTVMNILIP
jgi:hypothetical protein